MKPLPEVIPDLVSLEDLLSEPTPGVIETMGRFQGDLILLGAGGKMGPSLARMARRASDAAGVARRIIAVSRFSDATLVQQFNDSGVETIPCDLLQEGALDALPDAPNIIYMTGMKFGTSGQAHMTWAMNTLLPARVCERYRNSTIVAFSTGNIYGLVPADSTGSHEDSDLNPVGEYAMSSLGRERIFTYTSHTHSIPMSIIRLNYAVEMRYGVLCDLASRVWEGLPISLEVPCFNVIWQRDANAMTLQSFDRAHSPPFILNVTGPEILRVREIAETFGKLFDRTPVFEGRGGEAALLNDASQAFSIFGKPMVSAEQVIAWTADWIKRDGLRWDKPTHFEVKDGKF